MGLYHLRARDIMQVEIATILGDATAQEAAYLMRMEGVRSLIVVPRDEKDPYGIVTYADIVSKVLAEAADPSLALIDDIMTKPLIMITPGMTIQHIARLFRQTKAGHAPVMDGDKLIGVVSMTDLITEAIPDPQDE